jgi:hypothetical protein
MIEFESSSRSCGKALSHVLPCRAVRPSVGREEVSPSTTTLIRPGLVGFISMTRTCGNPACLWMKYVNFYSDGNHAAVPVEG